MLFCRIVLGILRCASALSAGMQLHVHRTLWVGELRRGQMEDLYHANDVGAGGHLSRLRGAREVGNGIMLNSGILLFISVVISLYGWSVAL